MGYMAYFEYLFLSTPSARRATCTSSSLTSRQSNFYPRPPRGGRPSTLSKRPRPNDFYPRPPRGGRLERPLKKCSVDAISIHALREEGDTPTGFGTYSNQDFYPRPPRGGRHAPAPRPWLPMNFYPRPPRGGRRSRLPRARHLQAISIHALREEGDAVSMLISM